jgi:tetratricopeptide (TPR) repeat protein
MTVLKESLASNQPGMREEAFARLAERTDPESEKIAVEYALEQLKTQPMSEPVRVLLSRTKDKRALPLLWKQYDRTPNKGQLLQTLALIGDQETVRELLKRYDHMQEYEKAETIKILAKLSPTEFRKRAILAINSNSQVMSFAIQGLQDDGGPDSVKILAEALEKSPHQNVWMNVCNALSMLGTPAGRAALIKARDSGVPEKRNAAHQALVNMMSRSPGYGYYLNAKQHVKDSRWKEALEQFDNAIQADPELSDAYAERGNVYLRDGKLEQASKDYEKASTMDPFNHQGLTGLCIVMVMKDGKYTEAIKKVEDSRNKFGDNNIFRYNVACVYARAVEYLQKNDKVADREKLIKDYSAITIKELQASIQGGFQELDWMQKDPDLKSLQGTPEFKKMIEDAKEQGRGVGNAIRGPRRIRGGMRNFAPVRGFVR